MAGRPNLSSLEGTEGENFDDEELGFGDTEEQPTEEEIAASAEGESPPEGEDGEEQVETEEGAEGEEEIEYEEDGEGGEETPAGVVAPPAQEQPAPLVAQQPPASVDRPARTPVLHEALQQNEKAIVDGLAKGPFKLSGEDAEMFDDENLRDFVARNNASVFVKTITAVSQLLHAALPAAVANLSDVHRDVKSHEDSFFKDYADLKPVAAKLPSVMALVIQNNPGMVRSQVASETARIARAMFNLKAAPAVTTPNGKPKIKTLSRMPFKPAGTGAAPRPAGGPKQKIDALQAINDMLMNESLD